MTDEIKYIGLDEIERIPEPHPLDAVDRYTLGKINEIIDRINILIKLKNGELNGR